MYENGQQFYKTIKITTNYTKITIVNLKFEYEGIDNTAFHTTIFTKIQKYCFEDE